LFGGKSTFGTKTSVETVVKTTESHDWIRVAYTIAFIDSWDVDYLSFQINDVPL